MEKYSGFILIAAAIIGLVIIFRIVLRKGGAVKGLLFWLFASASIGFVSPYISQIQGRMFGSSNEFFSVIINIVFFLLGGFIALLITAIWNGIFYGKWKVTQGE